MDSPIRNPQSETPDHDEIAGQAYWRSLNEQADSPQVREALAKEFPGYDPDELLSMGRRKFLTLAGASMALAGLTLTGCRRWPKEQVLPYTSRPEGTMPGVPEKFASMVQRDGFARGLFVTSFDGRPIGVDGNPLDPTVGDPETARVLAKAAESGDIHAQHKLDAFVGVADSRAQAMTLEMYDPDRARGVLKVTPKAGADEEKKKDAPAEIEASSWDAFNAAVSFEGRQKVAVLAEPMSGPTAEHMRRRFQGRFGNDSWHTWTPLNRDSEVSGARLAFGTAARAHYDVSKAKVIACFDSDFLSDHPAYITNARGWAQNRRSADDAGTMNRVYAVAPALSPTVAVADEHLQVKPSRVAALLEALANKLGVPGVSTAADLNGSTDFINHLASDLKAHPGESIVVAGPSQPDTIHALVWVINDALGNLGSTITTTEETSDTIQSESISALVEKLNAGQIDTLLVLGGNPAFDGPADLNLKQAIGAAESVVRLGYYFDETSAVSDWHLPLAHPFECWGDGRGWDGTLLLQQPIIEPMFAGKSSIEMVALAVGDELTAGYDLVRRAWSRVIGDAEYSAQTRGWGGTLSGLEAEKTWRAFVHDGFVSGTAFEQQTQKPNAYRPVAVAVPSSPTGEENGDAACEIAFRAGPAYDGRNANNGWLQELPQPLSKLTWDTPAHLAVLDAKDMGVKNGDHVKVTVGETTVELPCFVNPGQARGTVVLPVGGGREVTGNVGTGVGNNVYPLRNAGNLGFGPAAVEKGKGHTPLATTSDHHLINPEKVGDDNWFWNEDGQLKTEHKAIKKRVGKPGKSGYLVKEATLAEYLANKHFATEGAHGDVRLQLFDPPSVTADREGYVQPNPDGPDAFNIPHAWGMSIDMTTCTGCNACIVACQSENNVPVVGKDQVLRSREMHWIRIDTYFKGDPAATSSDALYSVNMPVACVQCENAPCEQVCPVAATVHDTEGLNTMVYNRCIGTRYCSNNCPYKVRRFNYFDYHTKLDSDFFKSKHVGIEIQNKPWLAMPDMQQGDVVDQVRRMVFNPDVTMRMRGVMEKCTYCTQRIARAKITNKADWARRQTLGEVVTDDDRLVQDGEVRTACQTACPTNAIVFGDLNDPGSAVSKLQQQNPRSYKLLEELNSRPRTEHMGIVRNPARKPGSGKALEKKETKQADGDNHADSPEKAPAETH